MNVQIVHMIQLIVGGAAVLDQWLMNNDPAHAGAYQVIGGVLAAAVTVIGLFSPSVRAKAAA